MGFTEFMERKAQQEMLKRLPDDNFRFFARGC